MVNAAFSKYGKLRYVLPKERDNLTSSEWLQILTKYVIELTKRVENTLFWCGLISLSADQSSRYGDNIKLLALSPAMIDNKA